MRSIYSLLGVNAPFDPNHLYVTSHLLTPTQLAILRLTLACYTLITLIVTLAYNSAVLHSGNSYFTYFTYLSYTGLCAYFWASGVQTAAFARKNRQNTSLVGGEDNKNITGSERAYPLQTWPRLLQFMHVWLGVTVYTFPLIVLVVFWSLLASSDAFATHFKAYSNTSIHILNAVFAITDLLLSATPPAPWLLLLPTLVTLSLYLGVAYVQWSVRGVTPYPFLQPKPGSRGRLAGYIFGIALACCIAFLIVRIVAVGRDYFARRGGKSRKSERIQIQEEMKSDAL